MSLNDSTTLPTPEHPRTPFFIPATRTQASEPSVGVLFLHGFTGAVYSVRDWALGLSPDYSVSAPALPGHHGCWQDLRQCTWHDWYLHAEEHLRALAAQHDYVVVAGFSMGGALALRLAQKSACTINGLILVNPALSLHNRAAYLTPALQYAIKTTSGIGSDAAKPGVDEHAYTKIPVTAVNQLRSLMRTTRQDLEQVTTPVLILRSRHDHVVSPSSHESIMEKAKGPVKIVMLPNSYHVATLDYDANLVFERSRLFVDAIARGRCPITGQKLDK